MKAPKQPFSRPDNEQADQIAEQAIVWFARLQSGELSTEERLCFQTWKMQSPAHRQAYSEASQLWDDSDFNQALKRIGLSDGIVKKRRNAHAVRKWLPLSLAASVALLALLFDPVTRVQADYYTPVGASQTVRLSDGSNVTLNTDSAVAVAFNEEQRFVRLLKGEAYFDVRRDEGRPFVVDSGETETRVLGTRFIVRDGAAEDKVTVMQGLVNVSNKANRQNVLLHPDEQVGNTSSGLTAVRLLADHRESGWLKGRLSFQDTPLEQVVNDVDRYLPGLILFSDPTLKTYRINARFDVTRPSRALDTLEQTLPIKITYVGNWLTVIGRR